MIPFVGDINLVNRLATEWHVFKTGGRQTTYVFVCPSVQANVGLIRDLGMSIGQGEREEEKSKNRHQQKAKAMLSTVCGHPLQMAPSYLYLKSSHGEQNFRVHAPPAIKQETEN